MEQLKPRLEYHKQRTRSLPSCRGCKVNENITKNPRFSLRFCTRCTTSLALLLSNMQENMIDKTTQVTVTWCCSFVIVVFWASGVLLQTLVFVKSVGPFFFLALSFIADFSALTMVLTHTLKITQAHTQNTYNAIEKERHQENTKAVSLKSSLHRCLCYV